jgi:hypothetical protein
LKELLSSFKERSSQKKREQERGREVKEGGGQGGRAGEPGQLVKKEKIRGKDLGSPKNKIHALDNPE